MTTYDETLHLRVSPKLKQAIAECAVRERRTPSDVARMALEDRFLPNEVTIRQRREALPYDPREQDANEVTDKLMPGPMTTDEFYSFQGPRTGEADDDHVPH